MRRLFCRGDLLVAAWTTVWGELVKEPFREIYCVDRNFDQRRERLSSRQTLIMQTRRGNDLTHTLKTTVAMQLLEFSTRTVRNVFLQ
jgi:hypothetical protein